MNNFFHFLSIINRDGYLVGPYFCSCGEESKSLSWIKYHIKDSNNA